MDARETFDLPFRSALPSPAGGIYVTLQRLGIGGSAETYLVQASKGRHPELLFALKLFRRRTRPQWRDTFLREHAFLHTCDHPAVMRVFDEGLYLEDHPFTVAEYLPHTLAAELPAIRARALTVEKLSYASQLLAALDYLARPEIAVVHRDVKPENIFLKGGSCVLGDFGLMKRHDPDPAADRPVLKESLGWGMPRAYRTPDLVAYLQGGPPPTPRSDVFQLGLVLAELFIGMNPLKPIEGDAFTAPVELTPLDTILGDLGNSIRTLIQQMLTLDRDSRPAAADLLGSWQELFLEAARRAYALNGQVF
jgi:serine/threonine protein kinase